MALQSSLVYSIQSGGADLVGIAAVDSFKTFSRIEWNPGYYIKDARFVVVIALKVVDAIWDSLTGKNDVHSSNLKSYLHHYHYNQLDFICVQACRWLENNGYDAYPILTRTDIRENGIFQCIFPFKYAAAKSGLGKIGRNTLLQTPQFGPRIRLSALITNAPLEGSGQSISLTESEKILSPACERCKKCIESCPVGALLIAEPFINSHLCQAYLDYTQCALCQAVCPQGKRAANNRRKVRSGNC